MEKGEISWANYDEIQRDRMRISLVSSVPEKLNIPCPGYNYKTCKHADSHDKLGICFRHICGYCLYNTGSYNTHPVRICHSRKAANAQQHTGPPRSPRPQMSQYNRNREFPNKLIVPLASSPGPDGAITSASRPQNHNGHAAHPTEVYDRPLRATSAPPLPHSHDGGTYGTYIGAGHIVTIDDIKDLGVDINHTEYLSQESDNDPTITDPCYKHPAMLSASRKANWPDPLALRRQHPRVAWPTYIQPWKWQECLMHSQLKCRCHRPWTYQCGNE